MRSNGIIQHIQTILFKKAHINGTSITYDFSVSPSNNFIYVLRQEFVPIPDGCNSFVSDYSILSLSFSPSDGQMLLMESKSIGTFDFSHRNFDTFFTTHGVNVPTLYASDSYVLVGATKSVGSTENGYIRQYLLYELGNCDKCNELEKYMGLNSFGQPICVCKEGYTKIVTCAESKNFPIRL